MKIALIGYGKMGKEVEIAALHQNHTIVTRIDNEQDWLSQQELFLTCDAAIEFSAPAVAADNIKKCLEAGIPVISGTTGWYLYLPEIMQECYRQNGSLFYASNFSIGVNIFFEINRRLALLMNKYTDYDVKIDEIHHIQKLDAPSGTAITIANEIIQSIERKNAWINSPSQNPDQLVIHSIREGAVAGIHSVCWESDIDSITLRHEAKSRRGFAIGAVLAAEFLLGKKGIFGMKDLLNI